MMRFLRPIIIAVSFFIPLTCAAQYDPFPPPSNDTVGLFRDPTRPRWWVSDRQENAVLYRDDTDKRWVPYLTMIDPQFGDNVVPGPIAMSGTILWLVVEGADTAHIVAIETSGVHPSEAGTRIEIPPSARRRAPTVTGLAWDRDHLWLITSCGLCSTLYKIDDKGAELFSIFPGCEARGMTFNSNGTGYKGELWVVAYNGPRKQPLFSRRRVSGSPSTTTSSHELFVLDHPDGPPEDPVAIAKHGYKFWVLDRDVSLIKAYAAVDLP